MPTPMSAFAAIAAQHGVDPNDEDAIDVFFERNAQSLSLEEQSRIFSDLVAAGPSGAAELASPLDRVADAVQRDPARRLALMQVRLAKDVNDVREETRARLESLENYVKKEIQSLVERLTVESTRQSAAAQAMKEATRAIADQMKAVDERTREQMLAQTRTFREELQRVTQVGAQRSDDALPR